jgi:hypothetical protein
MNYVAGILLIFLNEEETFFALNKLIGTILPQDYYVKDLLGVHVDIAVLKALLQQKMKKLYDFLEERKIDIALVCLEWFLCLFVNTLPIETVLRLWDNLFVEGSRILFKAALALFRIHSKEILNCEDSEEIYNVLRKMGNEAFDIEELISV